VDLAKVKLLERRNGELLWKALTLYNQTTREVGLEKQVPVIELGEQMPRSSRYYFDPVHFTNAGAQVAGTIIEEGLCPLLATRFPAYKTAPCHNSPRPALSARSSDSARDN
jgi:hypothetical protein